MRLLNAGCGGNRLPEPWVNLDELRAHLAPGTPERANLDAEPNYVDHRLGSGPMPFADESFDGVLLSHVIEHMDAIAAVATLRDVRRVLKTGGCVVVSVPDASYFRRVHAEDNRENAERLFGEPIHDDDQSFFDYALFHRDHRQVLTEDALWCLLVKAGFPHVHSQRVFVECLYNDAFKELYAVRNRPKFSLEMAAFK